MKTWAVTNEEQAGYWKGEESRISPSTTMPTRPTLPSPRAALPPHAGAVPRPPADRGRHRRCRPGPRHRLRHRVHDTSGREGRNPRRGPGAGPVRGDAAPGGPPRPEEGL